MKKLLLSAFLLSTVAMSAQVTIFEDGFETYEDFTITGFGGWQTLDIDGLPVYSVGDEFEWPNIGVPQAWMVFNPSATTPPVTNATTVPDGENRNFDPHGGSKYAASWAAVPATTGGPGNNDYLVSPVIQLGASNNELTFWIKSLSDSYDLEEYRAYVYVGTGTPTQLSDFVIPPLTPSTQFAPYPNWIQRTFSLNTWSNQSIRIAIRNMGADHYMLMVDDVKVTSSNLAVDEVFSSKFAVYPNPSNGVINLSNNDNIMMKDMNITDINGRIVKSVNLNGVSEAQVNISDLSNGVYMLNIFSDQGKAVKKIVKQ